MMAPEETSYRKAPNRASHLALWDLCTGMRVENG